jgi:Catalytic LigB subunit of aromatic ring-opening dioxygenase
MAQIVLGIGCSHSPMLASPPEDYPKHAEIDRGGRPLLDRDGNPCSYGDLVAQAGPDMAQQLRPDVMEARAASCTANIARVAEAIALAKLDALIIIGDDQKEQFLEDNLPAVLIYWGDTIENHVLPLPEDAPEFWKRARSQYHEAAETRRYPVASALARHLIDHLMDTDFDISQSRQLARAHGEGHAFGFVHRRLMDDAIIPIIPVALNTYFPPNQMRPRRCFALGQALRAAVEAWPEPNRIGILASGGLSHFTVDEEFDHLVLAACAESNGAVLGGLPTRKLNTGSSEIRNWIVTAGAVDHLRASWQDYVPCYRSLGGTGCGMGFLVWE